MLKFLHEFSNAIFLPVAIELLNSDKDTNQPDLSTGS